MSDRIALSTQKPERQLYLAVPSFTMENLRKYDQAIRQIYPDLIINKTELISHGQNNIVLNINDESIFRFPKYEEDLQSLKREVTLLTLIQGKVSLAIPCPRFTYLEEQQRALMGYPMLVGHPLWKEILTSTSRITQANLARQLGDFLKTLHQIPSISEFSDHLPRADTVSQLVNVFQRVRIQLIPRMRPDAQVWAINHFETFLSQPEHFSHTPVLKHGDFGASNILFDQTTKSISGIIDFGNASLGDPAYDFAGLLSSYGENFVRQVGNDYPNFDELWPRIRFYQGTFALLEALFGLENSDINAYESGIAEYLAMN
ncbi:MAG: phosphotransferase [Cyanobacteria bacterium P01_A01_bin.15]